MQEGQRKKKIQFESFTNQGKLTLSVEIHAPLTVNGKIMHVSASTALRITGGDCKASALLLTPQDTENNIMPLTNVSKSKGIYSV